MFKKSIFGIILTLLMLFMSASIPEFTIVASNGTENNGDVNPPSLQVPSEILGVPWGDWAHYHNYSELTGTLLYLNSTYPSVVDVFSIGESWEGRDIYCVRLTNESDTYPKPKVFFVGYDHAREPISMELPLYFAVEAATSFGINADITRMLNYSEIYIVPALNVDGLSVIWQNDWQRKNSHPFDEDNDGLFDEDPPDDENENGYIEDLYLWDGADYHFVRWEGIDNDGDGQYNEDWIGGVDLNRNYGYEWDAICDSGSPYPYAEDFRGPSPFSEPETQAIRDLALSHDFRYAVSFHSGAENVVYPWGYTTTPTSQNQFFRDVAGHLSALVGAPYYQSGSWYTTSGVWDDWMYANRSIYALTCEIYQNSSAWQYEPGPEPNTWWERGIFQAFNPDPSDIEAVIQRWLPVIPYITDRAIEEAYTIVTGRTVVGQGYSTLINATVTNRFDFSQNLNITVYANSTKIKSQTISLTAGQSQVLTFTWNTTDWSKGNYIIHAHVNTLSGEARDTLYAFQDLFVTIPGDVDADRDVDIFDIVRMAGGYGSKPPNSRYDPNCDLDGDGDIDIFDIVMAAGNYSKKW